MIIKWALACKKGDTEYNMFVGCFFKGLLRNIKLQNIGRNFFDPKKAFKLPSGELEVWPGFYTAKENFEYGAMMMIDLTNKVIRKDNAFNYI